MEDIRTEILEAMAQKGTEHPLKTTPEQSKIFAELVEAVLPLMASKLKGLGTKPYSPVNDTDQLNAASDHLKKAAAHLRSLGPWGRESLPVVPTFRMRETKKGPVELPSGCMAVPQHLENLARNLRGKARGIREGGSRQRYGEAAMFSEFRVELLVLLIGLWESNLKLKASTVKGRPFHRVVETCETRLGLPLGGQFREYCSQARALIKERAVQDY